MKSLTVNGTLREYGPEAFPATVAALVESLDLTAGSVVAEVDGEIVPRERFSETDLRPGARVELVQFVGGG